MGKYYNINPNDKPHIQVYGGEMWVDDEKHDDYGITIDGLRIDGIKAEDLKRLVIEAVNHLIVNGHHFYFEKPEHPSFYERLKEFK